MSKSVKVYFLSKATKAQWKCLRETTNVLAVDCILPFDSSTEYYYLIIKVVLFSYGNCIFKGKRSMLIYWPVYFHIPMLIHSIVCRVWLKIDFVVYFLGNIAIHNFSIYSILNIYVSRYCELIFIPFLGTTLNCSIPNSWKVIFNIIVSR